MRVMKLLCSVGLATYKVSMDKNMNQELYIILLTHEKKNSPDDCTTTHSICNWKGDENH